MIELRLDGMRAVPKDNQTIKLTSENPLFTKSATYTYDVELPLDIPDNRRIFGFINRIDVTKRQRTMEAELIVDNICVIAGSAHITSVSDSAVKVQLLGGASAYNYYTKANDLYIDELDLGDWFTTTWPDRSYILQKWPDGTYHWTYFPPETKFKGDCRSLVIRANQSPTGEDETYSAKHWLHLGNGGYPWVAYPTINSTAGVTCNSYNFNLEWTEYPKGVLSPKWDVFSGDWNKGPVDCYVAIQPFLWIMAKKIATATGYKLDDNNNALFTDEYLSRIFIVHACNRIECNKCLPHWSVSEWWQQIENTFGLHLIIDSDSKTMSLIGRVDYFNRHAGIQCLNNVVDETTTEFDDETQVDVSANNVGFADFEADPADLLDDSILENCTVNNDFDSITDLLAWGQQQANLAAAYKGTLFNCKDGRQFIFTEAEGFVEVNQFRPRILDKSKDDIDIELKFVPAQLTIGTGSIYYTAYETLPGPGGTITDHPYDSTAPFEVKMLQVPSSSDLQYSHEPDTLDIEQVLLGTADAEPASEDLPDEIYLAIQTNFNELSESRFHHVDIPLKGDDFSGTFWYPQPQLRNKVKAALDGTITDEDRTGFSLSIVPVTGLQTLASQIDSNAGKISTKIRHCIKFISDSIPNPSGTFLIHNRRFVCEKIEVDIQATGLQKLMTGYFYETDL